ncbi:hypothetical protein [Deinococcus sp.]|uniref:hypothetical protein n=1 Tax=Deinococcus sp. TaxID=47478 RepID=UPI0025C2D6FD|nr:hypothetical protein [Deinococcus sp.]
MTIPDDTGAGKVGGEVLISGLDTGPSYDERQNRTPTDKLIGLSSQSPELEPEDEDG